MRNVTVQQTAKVFDDDGLSVSSNDSGYIDKSNSASSVYSEAAPSKYNNGGVTYSSYQNFLEGYGKKQFSTVQAPKSNVKSEIFIKINNDQTDHSVPKMNGNSKSHVSKVCEQLNSTPMTLNEKIQKFNIGEKSIPVKVVKSPVLVATVHEQNKPVNVEKGPIDFKIVLPNSNTPSPKTPTLILQQSPSYSTEKPSLPPTKPTFLPNKLPSPKPQFFNTPPPKLPILSPPQPMITTITSPIQYISPAPSPPMLPNPTNLPIPPPPKIPEFNSAPPPPKLPEFNAAPHPPKLPEFNAAPHPPRFIRKSITPTIQPSPIRKLSDADPLTAAKSSVIDEIKRRVEGSSPPLKNSGQPYVPQNSYGFTRSFANEPRNNYNTLPKGWKTKPDEVKSFVSVRSNSFNNKNASTALNNVSVRPQNIVNGSTNKSVLSNQEADITTKVAMFEEKPITKDDPNVKKLVYSTYRNLLGAYNNKANNFVATLPRNMVIEDKGVTQQLNSIASQGGLDHLNGRTKEPSDN